MADIYPLFPARVPWVDREGRLTDAAIKSLRQIVRLFGGESGNLPTTFVYIPANGTAFGISYLASDGSLTSTAAPTNGQFLIGRTGIAPALGTITGTVNRVTVTLGAGTITLNLPQDIHTAASPTFADLTLSGLTARSFLYSGVGGAIDTTSAPTNGQLLVGSTGANPVAAALTGTANQITVMNGAGSITLSLPQNIAVGSSPTFASLTLSGLTANSFTYSGAGGLISSTAAPTNGQLLIGNTGNAPSRAALTGTANQVVVTNGAGSITLSLPQDIGTGSSPTFANMQSGTYTPTLTNVANLDGSTAYQCQYMRLGNVVTVSGKVDINPTLTATSTQLGISLPVASNLGAAEDCAGTAVSPTIAGMSGAILGDTTNDRAQLQFMSSDINSNAMYFTFTYEVI
jgi:hypothetical protein